MNKSIKQTNIEFQTIGKYGLAKVRDIPNRPRQVEILWRNKPALFTSSDQVDIKSMGCNELYQALEKACHKLGFLTTFKKKVFKGPKALVTAYFGSTPESPGYATLIKPRSKSLRFSLNRVDLKKMKSNSLTDALKKVAFLYGSVCLKSGALRNN
jgi:hypothetical protein